MQCYVTLQLGNFTYIVNMHADPASAELVPQLSAPLGSTATHTLTLDNPVGLEVVLQISCSNPQTFILDSVSVVLPPYGQTELPVIYMPSTLGQPHLDLSILAFISLILRITCLRSCCELLAVPQAVRFVV